MKLESTESNSHQYKHLAICLFLGALSGVVSTLLVNDRDNEILAYAPGFIFGLIFALYWLRNPISKLWWACLRGILFCGFSTLAYYLAVYSAIELYDSQPLEKLSAPLRMHMLYMEAGFVGSTVLVLSLCLLLWSKPPLIHTMIVISAGAMLGLAASIISHTSSGGLESGYYLFVPWQSGVFAALAFLQHRIVKIKSLAQ